MGKSWIQQGNIDRVLLKLAIPAVIASLSELMLNLGDTFWVSFLGDSSVAALGAASYIIWIIFSLIDIVESSIISMISNQVGAGDGDSSNRIFVRLTVFFLILFSALIVPGIMLSKAGLRATGVETFVYQQASNYITVTFLFLPVMVIFYGIIAATQAHGNTRSPMEATIFSVVLNLILDPVLILFLKMDLTGLALASGISRIIGIFYLWGKFRETSGFTFGILTSELKTKFLDLKSGIRALKIGFPVSLGGISFSLIYFYILKIVAKFGTDAVAAMAVGNRIEGITYLFGIGYYTAVATVVGQNMGSRNTDRVEKTVKRALLHTAVFASIMGILFYFFPHIFGSLFLHQQKSIEIFKHYLRINAFNQIPMIYHVVLEGAFVGIGRTLPNFVIPIPFWLMRIPLSLILAFNLGIGVDGVWWAMLITQTLSTTMMMLWWKRLTRRL